MTTSSFKVSLPREGNEEICELLEVSNEILAKCEMVQNELWMLRLPKFFLWGYKRRLRQIGSEAIQLQQRWSEWDVRVRGWCGEPKFRFPQDGNNDVAFLHFTMDVRDRVNYVQRYIMMQIENYHKRSSEYEGRVNVLIALSSWFLTFLGLVASLIGLGISLN